MTITIYVYIQLTQELALVVIGPEREQKCLGPLRS